MAQVFAGLFAIKLVVAEVPGGQRPSRAVSRKPGERPLRACFLHSILQFGKAITNL
jgi:hypothetical protein